jgi:hypothetical protein
MSSITSIYIPAVRHFVSDQQMKYELEYQNIGKVLRIDFTKRGKPQHGFIEDDDSQDKLNKSAFVHFEYLYNTKITQNMVTCIESGNSFCLQLKTINENHYWLILQNRNPLPDSFLNTHQIVDKCKFLEFKIRDQSEELSILKKQISQTNNVLEQLIGGLFCQNTQSIILEKHLSNLHGLEVDDIDIENEDLSYPTTRQGDIHAEKIKTLELQNKKMSEILWELTGKEVEVYEPVKDFQLDDCESVSSHSSMPSLISLNYEDALDKPYNRIFATYYNESEFENENIV